MMPTPSLLELADQSEQDFDFLSGDRGGRLVHDDHAGLERERLGDFDDLLCADAQPSDGCTRVDVELQVVAAAIAASRLHPSIVDEAERRDGLAAQKDVLGHAEVRDQVQFLMDDGDPGVLASRGLSKRTRRPSSRISPGVGRKHAGEDVHQRRLAGAVLAEQRIEPAAAHRDVDAVECSARRETTC